MNTIWDVAKKAGVAISTVSKVLNNYPYVSEETKRKVREAIHELNYIPNTIAASLSSKQTARTALLLNLNAGTQVIDEITLQYIHGALNAAMEVNMEIITIFLSMIKHMTPEEITRYLQSQGITGIIICGMTKEDRYLRELVETGSFKSVLVDVPLINDNTSTVWVDNAEAQYEVAKKTITENKCESVLYLEGKDNGYVTDERLKGMKRLAEELNLKMLVRNGDFSELKARELTFKYAKRKDAVVAASDLMAIGAMNALIEMDIFRPVCGFDGITLMGYVGKQMNTVRQDFYNIASTAVWELKRLFEGGKGQNVYTKYELVKLYYKDVIV
ncbi:MAG: LacI family transcriptional regulator [Lachnospiraceae bacterium]|nr:LacI family transcriptional regulator [Lachnospiraceae bacterium]